MAEEKKFPMVDLLGLGNLLESLVATDTITCEERDKVILRLTKKCGFSEYTLSTLAGYRRRKSEVLEHTARRKTSTSQNNELDESYISLTQMAQAHSVDSPGYVIQRWLRSESTLAFLNLWEKENNPEYSEGNYTELLEKKKRLHSH